MAAQPLTASMPQLCDLPDGYIVRWNALDPTTGAAVAGVIVSDVSIYGQAVGIGTTGLTLTTGQPILIRQA